MLACGQNVDGCLWNVNRRDNVRHQTPYATGDMLMPAPCLADPVWYTLLDTPCGALCIAGTTQGLTHVEFQDGERPVRPQPDWREDQGVLWRGARAVAGVFRGTAPALHATGGAGGHAVSTARVAGASGDSVGHDDHVPGDRRTAWSAGRGASRRPRQRAQSHSHRHPVPRGWWAPTDG